MSDPLFATPSRALPVTTLASPRGSLVYAGPARAHPFLLAAPGGSARGTESRTVDVVEHRGRLLLAELSVTGFVPASLVLAPAHGSRELVGVPGTLAETLLVSDEGFIAQWTRTTALAGEIEVVLGVPGGDTRADGSFLVTEEAGAARLIQITPAPSWRVDAGNGDGILRVSATVRLHNQDVLLAAASGPDPASAFQSLRRLSRAAETRADFALSELCTGRLAIQTDGCEFDHGLAWSIARLEAADSQSAHAVAAGDPFPVDPQSRRAWTALGALAAGTPGPPDVDPRTPLGALAQARYGAWRDTPLSIVDLPQLADRTADRIGDSALRFARRAAMLAAANTIEPWERTSADELRARAAELVDTGAAPRPSAGASAKSPSRGRLPTVGAKRDKAQQSEDVVAATLAAALDLPGRPLYRTPADEPRPGLMRALTALACLNDGMVERGFALLERHLADGFGGGAGLWPDQDRVHDPASAALVPFVLLEGLLGARADAHYGRLRLAPRFPEHWLRFTVRGIQIADATVAMTYERVGKDRRFRFDQNSGAIPVTLVFEPLLPVQSDARAYVDGQPAKLDLRRSRDSERAQLRVQLPLDRPREVSVQ